MTIDGKDVYTEWGCKLLEGSFDDLLRNCFELIQE